MSTLIFNVLTFIKMLEFLMKNAKFECKWEKTLVKLCIIERCIFNFPGFCVLKEQVV